MAKRLDLNEAIIRAEAYKGLGRPIPADTRFAFLKKLEVQLTKPLLFRQVRYNIAVTDALQHLRMAAEGNVIAPATREQFAQHHEGISALRRDMVTLQQQLVETQLELEEAKADTRRSVAQLDLFLNEVRRALPAGPSAGELAAQPGAWDRLYNAFEDLQRGSFEEITSRLEVYLPDVPTSDLPVVDIGCGRGEWLELLKTKGVPSYGVDSNPDVADRAAQRGLTVETGNGLDHLRELTEKSVNVVTAFHVAEHLPLEVLIELLDLSLRALAPGGKLILETPNPANLTVGATTFWLDPTHVKPLPSQLLEFLVASRGFSDVEVRPLHRTAPPVSTAAIEDVDGTTRELVAVVNHHLGAAGDYAVVATRL